LVRSTVGAEATRGSSSLRAPTMLPSPLGTLLGAPGEVEALTAAESWTDKEAAQAPYDMKHLFGPQLTGYSLMAFRLMSENFVMKEVLYFTYSNKNALGKARLGGGQRAQRARARRAAQRAKTRVTRAASRWKTGGGSAAIGMRARQRPAAAAGAGRRSRPPVR
jgi:hypothetical protein